METGRENDRSLPQNWWPLLPSANVGFCSTFPPLSISGGSVGNCARRCYRVLSTLHSQVEQRIIYNLQSLTTSQLYLDNILSFCLLCWCIDCSAGCSTSCCWPRGLPWWPPCWPQASNTSYNRLSKVSPSHQENGYRQVLIMFPITKWMGSYRILFLTTGKYYSQSRDCVTLSYTYWEEN